jgi:hypothetical protein
MRRRSTADNACVSRSGSAVVVALAASLLMAGCAAAPETPRSATPSLTTVAPVATPTALPGEVTRSTFGGGAAKDPVGRVPQEGAAPTDEAMAVEVACSGTDGSTMSWTLESGDGKPLGLSGEADCSGPPSTSWLGFAGGRPATLRVALLPASGVVSGYAIARIGTP